MSIFFIVFIVSIFSLILGLILSYSSDKLKCKNNIVTEKINECLPQSQCGQCGYSSCESYSKAISNGVAEINKCTPGGHEVILQISNILNIEVPVKNIIKKNTIFIQKTVFIDEKNCVGCSKCTLFCPVDAIVGAPNFIHTVLQKYCTGCDICILHCPTNCIHITIDKKLHENSEIKKNIL